MRTVTVWIERVTAWPLLLAAALVPVFTLPFTPEQFEFPKLILIIVLVLVTVLLGAVRWRMERTPFVRTSIDVPVVIGWALVALATAFSMDRFASVFGAVRNAGGGFIAFTAYALIALAVARITRVESGRRQFLVAFGIGALLSALLFWLDRFGVFASYRAFVPQGNPMSAFNAQFSIAMGIAAVLACGVLATTETGAVSATRRRVWIAFWVVVFACGLVTVAAIGFRVAWIPFALGALVLLVGYLRRPEAFHPRAVFLVHCSIALALVAVVVGTPSALTVRVPTELSLTHRRSLQIVTGSVTENVRTFFVGSGPETFPYAFSAHRPEQYNAQPLWNVRFGRPVASTYEMLVGTGALGVIGFLILVFGAFFPSVVRLRRVAASRHDIPPAVLAPWVVALVALGLTAYGVTLWWMLFTLLGILGGALPSMGSGVRATSSGNVAKRRAALASAAAILAVAILVLAVIGLARWTSSSVWYARGVTATARRQYSDAERAFLRAIAIGPERVEHHLELASARLLAAGEVSRATPPETARLSALLSGAIGSARRATMLAPRSVAAWERLVIMYANARPFAKEANGWMIDALDHAIGLEPTNPRLILLRGGARQRAGSAPEALADVDRALALKSDYASAHYMRSVLLEVQSNRDGAITAAEQAIRFAPRSLDASFNLGRLLYNRNASGDSERAEATFRAILEKNRDYANAQYALGILFERQGRTREAREQYEAIVKRTPDHADVRARLERLGSGTPKSVPPNPEELEEEAEVTSPESGR
ncbi:MAG: tetratricopeptide repeat protein [bacterium]|nr:tetratricopeptide repeat protein [bacterium]